MTVISVTRRFSVEPLLDINDPEFAKWYSHGVWWSMYRDEQGHGPYDDRYLIDNISRNIQLGCYGRFPSPWFSSAGFYFGMLHGGYLARPSDTLVVLTDPDFTEGYQQGRQERQQLTDNMLASMIHQWALSRITDQALAYELGLLTGALAQMLIPAMLQTA